MARKKPASQGKMHQFSLRVPIELWDRITKASEGFGLDESNFLRMMLKRCLPSLEEEAARMDSPRQE